MPLGVMILLNVKTSQFPDLEGKLKLDYVTVVKYALSSAPGVRNLFVGCKLAKMEGLAIPCWLIKFKCF